MTFWLRATQASNIVIGSVFAYLALSDTYYSPCPRHPHPMLDCFSDFSVEPWSRLCALLAVLFLSSAGWLYIKKCGTLNFLGFDSDSFSAFDREHLHLGIQNPDFGLDSHRDQGAD